VVTEELPTLRLTTHHILPGAPDPVEEERRARGGFPWCDVCQRPSVGNFGLHHSTVEYPFGDYELDRQLDHDVTHRQWFATPTCIDDPFFPRRT
jgi:hypothetical protein